MALVKRTFLLALHAAKPMHFARKVFPLCKALHNGKTHLATALGYEACLKGYSVLFATAVNIINNLVAAQSTGRMKYEITKYTRPNLLIVDELGYLPIDKTGADMLFQIISHRYEQGFLGLKYCNALSRQVYKIM